MSHDSARIISLLLDYVQNGNITFVSFEGMSADMLKAAANEALSSKTAWNIFARPLLSHPECPLKVIEHAVSLAVKKELYYSLFLLLVKKPELSPDHIRKLMAAVEQNPTNQQWLRSGRQHLLQHPNLPADLMDAWSDPQFVYEQAVATTFFGYSKDRLPLNLPSTVGDFISEYRRYTKERRWSYASEIVSRIVWEMAEFLAPIAANSSIPSNSLERICDLVMSFPLSQKRKVLQHAVSSPAASGKLLARLSTVPDSYIQREALCHPRLPQVRIDFIIRNILQGRYKKNVYAIVSALCDNPSVSSECLAQLTLLPDRRLRELVQQTIRKRSKSA